MTTKIKILDDQKIKMENDKKEIKMEDDQNSFKIFKIP